MRLKLQLRSIPRASRGFTIIIFLGEADLLKSVLDSLNTT